MLVSLCKEKRIFDDTRQGVRKANEAQDRDILLAMRLGKQWCQKNRVTFSAMAAEIGMCIKMHIAYDGMKYRESGVNW